MSNSFEEHIRKNRAAFDEYEPSQALWDRVERELNKPEEAKVVKFPTVKWLVAAAVIAMAVLTIWFTVTKNSDKASGTELVQQVEKPVLKNSDTNRAEKVAPAEHDLVADNVAEPAEPQIEKAEQTLNRKTIPPVNNKVQVKNETMQLIDDYRNNISAQYRQLAVLKEHEPLLYQKFTHDLKELESSYSLLKQKAGKGVNNELILEEMVRNLQLQTELLQKQLYIIKTLKKEKDEIRLQSL